MKTKLKNTIYTYKLIPCVKGKRKINVKYQDVLEKGINAKMKEQLHKEYGETLLSRTDSLLGSILAVQHRQLKCLEAIAAHFATFKPKNINDEFLSNIGPVQRHEIPLGAKWLMDSKKRGKK